MVYLSVGCGELCLQIGLSVRWLGVICFKFGVVWVLGFFVCVVISIFTELLCFGRGI